MYEQENEHITAHNLSYLLANEIDEYESKFGFQLSLKPLGGLKDIADATTKFLLSSKKGKPIYVIVCSRPISPNLVLRGVENAEAIRKLVGAKLSTAIIKPIHYGYVDRRSYVVLPWLREFSRWKITRLFQKLSINGSLFKWLRDANEAATSVNSYSIKTKETFGKVLNHLTEQSFCNKDIRGALDNALYRLNSDKWKPLHTFDHNDLWLGNVMLNPRYGYGTNSIYPYTIIDWVGANTKGYGIYDLIRLSLSLRISNAQLRHELIAHSVALKCELEDLCGHLLASLGQLHLSIECFPEEEYEKTFYQCWHMLSQVLPTIK